MDSAKHKFYEPKEPLGWYQISDGLVARECREYLGIGKYGDKRGLSNTVHLREIDIINLLLFYVGAFGEHKLNGIIEEVNWKRAEGVKLIDFKEA